MKCQVCSTTKPERFTSSVLVCDICLIMKQTKNFPFTQDYAQKDVIIHGLVDPDFAATTKGIPWDDPPITLEMLKEFTKHNPPEQTFNCRCTVPEPSDEDRLAMARALISWRMIAFGRMMQQPIRIHVGWIRRSCDEHFDCTTPLLDNATLPLPLL